MLKGTGFLMTNLLIVFIIFSSLNLHFYTKGKGHFYFSKKQVENHPPTVKIISPKNNGIYSWNSRVPYQISISDKEDGESKYQEINSKEVFLEIRYVQDTAKALSQLKENNQKDSVGLAAIKTSNCMNCHAFNSKLIGPSFEEICKRYPHLSQNEDTLSDHILNGSAGRWGQTQMPSNKDLDKNQAKSIIEWIFKNAADPNVNYLAGNEGSFTLIPPSNSSKYALLIASYTDHGTIEHPDQKLKGEAVIIIRGK